MNLHWLTASVHCQSAQLGTITASIVANKAMANLRQRLNALIRTTRTGSPITCRQREWPTRSPNSNPNSVLSPEQVLQPVSLSSVWLQFKFAMLGDEAYRSWQTELHREEWNACGHADAECSSSSEELLVSGLSWLISCQAAVLAHLTVLFACGACVAAIPRLMSWNCLSPYLPSLLVYCASWGLTEIKRQCPSILDKANLDLLVTAAALTLWSAQLVVN